MRPAQQDKLKGPGMEGWMERAVEDGQQRPLTLSDSPFLETVPEALVWGTWVVLSSPLHLITILGTDLCMYRAEQAAGHTMLASTPFQGMLTSFG